MSNINYYLKSKLDFYDKSNEEYKHLICIKKEQLEYKEYENNDNMLGHEHYIVFKNTKNKEIYRGTVAKLGLFYKKSKIWVWAWANPTYAVSDTYGARNILLYGLDLNINDNTIPTFYIDLYQKPIFTSSRLYIKNQTMLDIIISLSLGITKAKFILPDVNENTSDLVDYYLVY